MPPTDTLTTLPTIHLSQRKIPTLNTFLTDKTPTLANDIGAVPINKAQISQVSNVIIQQVQHEKDADDDDEMEDVYTLVHHLDLKSFSSQKLNDQLSQVSILGLVDVSNEVIEKILIEVVEAQFKWSCVEEVGLKVVFVRLTDELKKNCQEIQKLLQLDGVEVQKMKLKVSVEHNTKQLIQDTLGDAASIDADSTVDKIINVLDKSKTTKSSKHKDMDYIIDESELKGIPEELLPQLRKDIKEFRLKALENEKRKREKEVLEEKKRAKFQLRKLFEKFRNESSNPMDVEDDNDDEDEEDDGLTDEQYEESQAKKEQQEMLRKFAVKLAVVHNDEKKNADLVNDLTELKKYESTLDKTMKEEYKLGKFRPSGRSRERELEADERDRKEESLEEPTKEEAVVPLKMSMPSSDVLTIDDSQLDDILAMIKPKINTYIEELMGVEDDEMADYIASIVKDERSKHKLLEELQEPMGDDAKYLAEKVWADVVSLL